MCDKCRFVIMKKERMPLWVNCRRKGPRTPAGRGRSRISLSGIPKMFHENWGRNSKRDITYDLCEGLNCVFCPRMDFFFEPCSSSRIRCAAARCRGIRRMRTNCHSGICEQAPDAFSQFARAWLKASRKKTRRQAGLIFNDSIIGAGSRSFDRAGRTCICAGAALKACIRIDLILAVALRNRVYRALFCTGSASNTLVCNPVCHVIVPPY